MSEIIVGADGSVRAEDAIAFARRLAGATGATVTLAGAFPTGRAANTAST